MSSDAPAALIQAIQTSFYIGASASAIWFLEYLLTLPEEISQIWSRPWSGSTLLFMTNRYVALTTAIMLLTPTPNYQLCYDYSYILFHRFGSKLYLCLFLATNVLTFVPGLNLCQSTVQVAPMQELASMTLVSRLSIILGDVLVLFSCWCNTYDLYKEAARAKTEVRLVQLVIRDGTLYFLALLAMNILTILNDTVPAFNRLTPASTLTSILVPVLINRFLLNLRQVNKFSEDDSKVTSRMSSLVFNAPNTIVGNMGEDLHVDDEDLDDEDLEERVDDESNVTQLDTSDEGADNC